MTAYNDRERDSHPRRWFQRMAFGLLNLIGWSPRTDQIAFVPAAEHPPSPCTYPQPYHGTAREYADHVAAIFLAWLRCRYPDAVFASESIADLAAFDFAEATGIVIPRERSLLAAVKRSGMIQFRADCRLRNAAGRTARKGTLYAFGQVPGCIAIAALHDGGPPSFGSIEE
jgi:hypothetical protein